MRIVSALRNLRRETLSFTSDIMFNNDLPWDLPHHRYAVLGIPRSGSQLFESFIKYSLSKKDETAVDLQELFTAHNPLIHTIYNEEGVIKSKVGSTINFWDAKKVSQSNLEMVRNSDINQAMTCRIFLHNNNSNYNFADSIRYAQELDFKFVYINRSFENTMLSLVFANESFIWNKTKNTTKLKVDTDQLKTMMAGALIYETLNKRVLDSMTDYDEVSYESIVDAANSLSEEEKTKAYGVFVEKQLPVDPYEQILNVDEVKDVFANFYPKVKEMAENL